MRHWRITVESIDDALDPSIRFARYFGKAEVPINLTPEQLEMIIQHEALDLMRQVKRKLILEGVEP